MIDEMKKAVAVALALLEEMEGRDLSYDEFRYYYNLISQKLVEGLDKLENS